MEVWRARARPQARSAGLVKALVGVSVGPVQSVVVVAVAVVLGELGFVGINGEFDVGDGGWG
eukprot:6722328-Alexandrium_andersonii.AAC.1